MKAQQSGNTRISTEDCKYRDSIMKIIYPQAEKWRTDYNSTNQNKISPFKTQNPEIISTNVNGKVIYGIVSYSANFQKEITNLESVDSLLLLSINSNCSEVILFSRQTGKANRQNAQDQIIIKWKETNGSWQVISHSEAIKNE
jgi:hypothetical protein